MKFLTLLFISLLPTLACAEGYIYVLIQPDGSSESFTSPPIDLTYPPRGVKLEPLKPGEKNIPVPIVANNNSPHLIIIDPRKVVVVEEYGESTSSKYSKSDDDGEWQGEITNPFTAMLAMRMHQRALDRKLIMRGQDLQAQAAKDALNANRAQKNR